MEIKRNIYQKLIDWKNESQEHFLLLSGTRYVGKTLVIIDEVQEYPVLYDYIKKINESK